MTGRTGANGQGGRSDLARRAVSGFVLAAGVLFLTWLGGWPFSLLWLAAGMAVAAEWFAMSGAEPRFPLHALAAATLAALALALRNGGPGAALAVVAAGTALAALVSSRPHRVWATLAIPYAALVAGVPVAVRGAGTPGLVLVLWMFAVVWTTDVAAYFVGRSVGGPRLWTRVSPKKTWSGFLGGVGAAALAGWIVGAVAASHDVAVPWGPPAVLAGSALAAAASQGGDLAESAMKRHFGVKDSGTLIPGHGGVMDRLDGFAAVLFLVALALLGARLAEP